MIKHDRISINSSEKKKKTDQHKKLKNEKNGFSQDLPWTIIERNNFNSYQSHVVSRRIHRLSLVPLA